MREVTTVAALRAHLDDARRRGQRIGFVPTMGFLHDGHLALVDAAKRLSDVVVMSIFVNPLQFGPTEDLSRYPRDLARDRALAEGRGVDLLFVPTVEEMYPPGRELRVAAGPTGDRWEGAHRPGHFDGVLTVVAKFFNQVQPDVALFGQKDIQQVTLVRQLIREFDIPVTLRVEPTVREADGLARSSRNVYLSAEDRAAALSLSRALFAARERWMHGERDGARLREAAEAVVRATPGVTLDYIAVADPKDLAPVAEAPAGTVVAVAARVGSTRLIDNLILGEECA